jgi:adenylosuccinate synthase
LPGWQASTSGVTTYADLPSEARAYIAHIEALLGIPVDLISTGAGRDDIVVRRHPFAA